MIRSQHDLVSRGYNSAFTLIEIIIVVTIVAILVGVSIGAYISGHRKAVLNTTAEAIQAALRLARQRAVSQQEGLVWGVHFENPLSGTPWYSIYKNSPYSSTNVTEFYSLPPQVKYVNPPAGATINIEFSKRTGTTAGAISIIIQLLPEGTQRTIKVSQTGVVEIE
jgi:prepilin-type N-terminal cleavage/methylation domain-containing protein